MADFSGKHGLIVGVNKRSIAWAIAQVTACAARGSPSRIKAASKSTSTSCRRASNHPSSFRATSAPTRTSRRGFARVDRDFGGLDFVVHGAAFAPLEDFPPRSR